MFTKTLLIASLVLAALPASGCVDDALPDSQTYPGTINTDSAPIFDGIQTCDVDTSCPSGLECMYVAALGLDSPVCVEASTICEAINCGAGECMILESYPAQLVCQSDTGGGDENCTIDNEGNVDCPDDCTVSSDGTTTCPEQPGEDSEPGSPGDPGSESPA